MDLHKMKRESKLVYSIVEIVGLLGIEWSKVYELVRSGRYLTSLSPAVSRERSPSVSKRTLWLTRPAGGFENIDILDLL